MFRALTLFVCFSILIFSPTEFVNGYMYLTKTFTVPVDHFSFSSNETFNIRYLINDSYWDRPKGPIFFYTGNEGDIELFARNTGFMWETAPSFQALLVFAEHRYYGNSLPFGNLSFSEPKYLGYLTSQQALADYVDLIMYLTENGKHRNPVIAIGGSYGGMLAAYLRMKYPHVVAGSLASSAPIWQFTGMTPCDIFARITSASFTSEKHNCSKNIKKSWSVINNITAKEVGRQWLSAEWKLCRALENSSDVQTLKDWLAEAYGNMAMLNYPYHTNFLKDLPRYPVEQFCQSFGNSSASGEDLLKSLFRGITLYFNHTGHQKCLNYDTDEVSPALGVKQWEYQACTEMVMPMCTTGKFDMFEPKPWNNVTYGDECLKKWKVSPQPFLAEKIYGGKNIATASNIIFSNGLLDPWAGGGVLKAPSRSVMVMTIPDAAHHLDLRETNPFDPPSITLSRKIYKEVFKFWIRQYRITIEENGQQIKEQQQ